MSQSKRTRRGSEVAQEWLPRWCFGLVNHSIKGDNIMRGFLGMIALLWGLVFTPTFLQGENDPLLTSVEQWPGVIHSRLGITGKGTRISCVYPLEDLNLHSPKVRVLLVSGFENQTGTKSVLAMLKWFYSSEEAKTFRERITLSAVPLVNPDNAPAGKFPPKGDAYNSRENTEASYLWRWVGMHAPDVVICLEEGETEMVWTWPLKPDQKPPQSSAQSLMEALNQTAPANTGTIPAMLAVQSSKNPRSEQLLQKLLTALQSQKLSKPSPARQELQKRVNRKPLEIAKQLAKVYGHELSSVQYISALALVGRLRLGELKNDATHRAEVLRIVEPYGSGKKQSLGKNFGGSHLAGHLIFAELARTAKSKPEEARFRKLARIAADVGFDQNGNPKPAMPAHSEMSDAVFMGCPILIETAKLTGEEKYQRLALSHFAFMKKRVLREDGIYRHSPLCETAWGRGNGFPALGLAWSLSVMRPEDPAFPVFLNEFQTHLRALRKLQDPNGMWHQVMDDAGSYRELTSTCMITFAMIRGVRNGWLDAETFCPVIEKAFQAIKTRIAADGTLVDVCTGTGKQKTQREYYDRKAILGRDARGGAMALLVVTEMAAWQQLQSKKVH